MNKILKKITIFIIPMVIILTLFACTVNTNGRYMVAETSVASADRYAGIGFLTNDSYKMMANNDAIEQAVVSYDIDENESNDQKIIKTVDITAETKILDDTISWFTSCVKKYAGSIDNSYVDYGNIEIENYRKSAHYTVRIPIDRLNDFINSIGDSLNITFKNENARDVTEDYDDTEARVHTLKLEEEKLNELMEKAKTVEDMVKIEDKLSEVRSELERITRRLKRFDRDITYSTVNITINEVKDLTEMTQRDDFTKDNIFKLIRKNYEDTKSFIIGISVSVITHLPAIIAFMIAVLIVLIIVAICKTIWESKEKKSEEKASTTFDDKNRMLYDVIEDKDKN